MILVSVAVERNISTVMERNSTTMKDIENKIHKLLKERGWEKLQPVDLSKSIMIEGAELLELFQWENPSLEEIKKNKELTEEIKKELADVLIYSIEMSMMLKFDLKKIISDKLDHIAKKYPASLMRGGDGVKEYMHAKKEYRKGRNK